MNVFQLTDVDEIFALDEYGEEFKKARNITFFR